MRLTATATWAICSALLDRRFRGRHCAAAPHLALQMSVNLQLVEQAAAEIGATDVLLEYGRNDINASGNPQTASNTEGYLETIAAPLLTAGYRVWVFTIPPTTDSTDGWITATGQFLQQQASATTAATSAGSSGAAVTIGIASTSGIQTGEFAGYQYATSSIIPSGTTVTAVGSSTSVTLTPPPGFGNWRYPVGNDPRFRDTDSELCSHAH